MNFRSYTPPPPPPPIFRGSNVTGQINVIINKMFIFNILLRILCLKSGPPGHHRRLAFLLCDALQACTAADSECSSIELTSGEWLGHWRTLHFFTINNSWVAFAVWFGSSSICTMKCRPILLHLAESGQRVYTFKIPPAASVFCHIITKYQ